MGRPRKSEQDDRYNEESLNLHQDEKDEELAPYDPETEDVLPELGETGRQDLFESLRDEESFDENRS